MTFHYVQILLLTQFWWVTCYSYTFVRDPILFLLGKTERLLKAWFVDKCISVQGMFALLLSGFPITGCVSIVFCNISPYGGAWTCKFLWWFNSGTTYRSFCHNSWVKHMKKRFPSFGTNLKWPLKTFNPTHCHHAQQVLRGNCRTNVHKGASRTVD